ncbi:MAG: rhomboid family intramembrane serine protease [Propionibacteriales bacterium]|nr:rhomboid family intramembrane serine protease [Propionibacteriales bacterium]
MTDPQGPPVAAAPVCYRHPGRETWIRCQRCDRPICPDCMNSAAVGFQCPSCIKEGARTTRSPRAPYGGSPSANPALSSIGLIAINVAVWLSISAAGGGGSALVDKLALLPRTTLFGNSDGTATLVKGVSDGAYWQLATSVFSHVEVWHIAFNMLALYFLGPQLEAILGRARFLAVYLLSGLASSTAVLWLSSEHTQTLGASGAIFGLMGALLVVGLKLRANVQQLLFWIGINVVFTVTASSYISWQGHFGGLLGGAVLAALVVYAPRQRRATFQWSSMAAFAAVCVVLIGLRIAALS